MSRFRTNDKTVYVRAYTRFVNGVYVEVSAHFRSRPHR